MSEFSNIPKAELERMLDEAITVLKRTQNKKYWEKHKKAIQKELKTRR